MVTGLGACLELDSTVRTGLSYDIVDYLESDTEFPGDGHASCSGIVPQQDGDLDLLRDRGDIAVILLVPTGALAGGTLEWVAADRHPVVSAKGTVMPVASSPALAGAAGTSHGRRGPSSGPFRTA